MGDMIEILCADCEERFDTPTDKDNSPVFIHCEKCREQYRFPITVTVVRKQPTPTPEESHSS